MVTGIPTQIVDKNGKITTVYKQPEYTGTKRAVSLPKPEKSAYIEEMERSGHGDQVAGFTSNYAASKGDVLVDFSAHLDDTMNKGRAKAIAEGLDPDAISDRSIHGDTTNAHVMAADIARAELDHFEHHANDPDFIEDMGGEAMYAAKSAAAFRTFDDLNSH